MPAYTRGSVRDQLRFVRCNPVFLYGWKTKDLAARVGVSQADLTTALGHLDVTAALAVAGRIMVSGANSPKPPRVVLRDPTAPTTQSGSTSTFCGFNSIGTAQAAGWTLAKGGRGVRLTANTAGRRSVSAIATLSNGLRYVFPMNKADFDLSKAALGLEEAAQITTDIERRSLVTGSRSKPGKASIERGGIFSSFYSTDSEAAALAAGYSIESSEIVEYGAAGGGGGGGV